MPGGYRLALSKKQDKMKALVFEQAGEAARVLQYKDIPQPLPGAGEVLVQVQARPVNPSDHYFIQGVYRRKPVFPQVAGLEGTGVIAALGAGVTGFETGQPVAFRAVGTWAEYCVVPVAQLIPITMPLPPETAAQLGLNTMTAVGLLEEAQLKPGQFLLVDAASSSTADLLVQMAAQRGIRVAALVRAGRHLSNVKGAEWVALQDDPQLVPRIQEWTNGAGLDGFLDAVGGPLLGTVLQQMAPFGTVLTYGNFDKGAVAAVSNATLVYRNLTLKGFGIDRWMSLQPATRIQALYTQLVEDLHSGRLTLLPVPVIGMQDATGLTGLQKVILV